MNRSFLFVPGDSETKLARAADCGADALILDLEDSVDTNHRGKARDLVGQFLAESIDPELWVRINPLTTEDCIADLRAVMPFSPHGIVLPKPQGANDVKLLSDQLHDLEREHKIRYGSTLILPIATERPAALFTLQEYANETARLAGLTWGAEDLSAAVGASANRRADGRWLPPYELARSLCLFAAAAAKVPAIDTVYTDFRNYVGLAAYAEAARRDGFSGMMAIHPNQVAIINAAFLPSAEEITRANRIVNLFAEKSGVGVMQLDGEMIDRPHYIQAKNILEMVDREKKN